VLSLPQVGALIDPNVEQILALRPDLVVVYATQNELITQLDRAGIDAYRYEHAGLADITTTIRLVGERVGHGPAANRLADAILEELDAIARVVRDAPRPSTAVIFGRERGTLRGIFASGGIGFMHDMLVVAGGRNVFEDVQRQSVQVSAETLIARAPDVILEMHPPEGWTEERAARERLVWSTLRSVPAVRDDRTYLLVDYILLVPGPRAAEAVRKIAETLHPDLFDVDTGSSRR
jgi:iron complex transport system substrate-binding protein